MALLVPFLPFAAMAGGTAIVLGTWLGLTDPDDPVARSLPLSNAVIQLDAGEMRLNDLHRFHGLQMNVIGEGKAMFSAAGFASEGNFSRHHLGPHHGVHTGNFSVAIPGLEDEARGEWLMVRPSEEADEKVVQAWDELYGKLLGREQHAKETAAMMEALMQT